MKYALITQREEINQYGGLSDCLEKEYIEYFKKLDICAIPISNFATDIQKIVKRVKPDLIILSGGGTLSIECYTYNENVKEQVNRDNIEKQLLNIALKEKIPLLGICRGMQQINSFFDGKTDSFKQYNITHDVCVSHNLLLNNMLNMKVNSFHNNGIIQHMGKNLIPLCVAQETNIVEAFKHKELPILGVQWHPERDGNDQMAQEWIVNKINQLIQR